MVVLGTGAAGLVAALAAHEHGASVALFEKGDVVGGTTALSGGIVWIPNNPHAAAAGLADSREDALVYLDSLSLGMIDPEMARTLVDTGPDVLQWLEATTPLRFEVVTGFPDYHPERPGGKPAGGRSLDPGLFNYVELGDWADRVARTPRVPRLNLLESPLGGGSGTIDPAALEERDRHDARGAATPSSVRCSQRASSGASNRSPVLAPRSSSVTTVVSRASVSNRAHRCPRYTPAAP